MTADPFEAIRSQIIGDESNREMTAQGWHPLFTASARARVAIIGQAPGIRAQTSGIPWDDKSGLNLIDWLGVSADQFRDPHLFTLLPMDFYYPGKGSGGDLPPRKGFAQRWHPPLLALMPNIRLTLLIGRYAQLHYLPATRRGTLTDSVRDFRSYLPAHMPLVHPSPLNFRWQAKNPWFTSDVVPVLRARVADALGHGS